MKKHNLFKLVKMNVIQQQINKIFMNKNQINKILIIINKKIKEFILYLKLKLYLILNKQIIIKIKLIENIKF